MSNPFGYLKGSITKVENDRFSTQIEVCAENGHTCFVTDLYRHLATVEVGTSLELEDATIIFENGVLVYMIDQEMRGVFVGEATGE